MNSTIKSIPTTRVCVEICLSASSTASVKEIKEKATGIIDKAYRGGIYQPGSITSLFRKGGEKKIEAEDADVMYLSRHIQTARICDIEVAIASSDFIQTDGSSSNPSDISSSTKSSSSSSSSSAFVPFVSYWEAQLVVFIYQLNEDGPSSESATSASGEGNGEGGESEVVNQYTQWSLPAREFEGIWESLIYDDEGSNKSVERLLSDEMGKITTISGVKRGREGGAPSSLTSIVAPNVSESSHIGNSLSGSHLKTTLLNYAQSALLFSDAGVDPSLIAWNHVILLHGPPGTGKTSLCKALAQKLAIRLGPRYPSSQLIEINAHSLFSRWFSESGKLVHRLFSHIGEMVADEDSLIILLIDEVESLTSARKAAISGSEPSDAVRVVNAVLTAIDSFRTRKNVLLLTTSNVSEAIDVAFVDRADIKAYVGPPGHSARFSILATCLLELVRAKIVTLCEIDSRTPCTKLLTADEVIEVLTIVKEANQIAATSDMVDDGISKDETITNKTNLTTIAASGFLGSRAEELRAIVMSKCSRISSTADLATSLFLWQAAEKAIGFSGRSLRKLPLQAHSMFLRGGTKVTGPVFADAIEKAVVVERRSRDDLEV
jgi:hypothetical protein